ncbi:MAG TPA: peptidylprolyl isomerase [Aliiroseovarius sp.]|nr:peptidylprolyl isomerase [Aliiroseovarius sp.]
MINTKTAIAALLLAATPVSALWAQDTTEAAPAAETEAAPMMDVTADTVLATVNGTDITLGHVIATRGALPDNILFEGILEQLVQQTLLAQAAGEVSRRTQLEIENETRSLTASEKLQELTATAVTEEALQKLYDETYANAEAEPEYNASHILVDTKEKAQELIDQLNDGADFAELAKENSTGPSAPGGGSLGWFSKGMMVEPFETAVIALEPGQVAQEPVQTQFGWHVIKLNEVREKAAPPLSEVAEELVQKLQDDAIEAALKTLEDGANIERVDLSTIDPSVLRQDDLLQ